MNPETNSTSHGLSQKTETGTANLLREQLIKLFNLPADASYQDVEAAARSAQEYNDNIKKQLAEQLAEEDVIATKMKVGLTREQAVNVIKRQRQHDAALAKMWEKRRPEIVKILKEKLKERDLRARVRELDASITIDEINAAKEWLQGTRGPAAAPA